MEDIKRKSLFSRKNEARSLFKKCFEKPIFSLVPFEIWRDLIVSNADARSIAFLSQTCWGFKEIVDVIGENNFNFALLFRKEGQIVLAKKYLKECANNGNALAMFHLGYSYYYSGWGLRKNHSKASQWFKKSGESGNDAGIAGYAFCMRYGYGQKKDIDLGNAWGKKALSSNSSFAKGYCYYWALGSKKDYDKAFLNFEASAKEGDEFGQYMLGECYFYGDGVEKDTAKAFKWFMRSAEQGLYDSIFRIVGLYADGSGCVKSEEQSKIWSEKGKKQQYERELNPLHFF